MLAREGLYCLRHLHSLLKDLRDFMGICFLFRVGSEPLPNRSNPWTYSPTSPSGGGVGCWQNWPPPCHSESVGGVHTAVLASRPWGPHAFFFSSEAALCSFCLFDFSASFKFQHKSNLAVSPLASAECTTLAGPHCPPRLLSLSHLHGSFLAGMLPALSAWLPQEGGPWFSSSTITHAASGPAQVLHKHRQPQSSDAQSGHASVQELANIYPALCVLWEWQGNAAPSQKLLQVGRSGEGGRAVVRRRQADSRV